MNNKLYDKIRYAVNVSLAFKFGIPVIKFICSKHLLMQSFAQYFLNVEYAH
jgi:hypothetical protein